jgi:transglutaminase superfamily protein
MAQQPFQPGSIDRRLLQSQTLLSRDSRGQLYGQLPAEITVDVVRSELRAIVEHTIDPRQPRLGQMFALTRWCNRIPKRDRENAKSTLEGNYNDFSSFLWGGSEEYVIAKGSPWPQEVARVLARLLQLAAIPARLVFLYSEDPARMHCVVEAWPQEGWVVCDPCANRCYIWPHRGYASALDLRQHPQIFAHAPEHGQHPYVDPRLYQVIGIAEYPLRERPPDESDLSPTRTGDELLLQQAAEAFGQP